MERLVQAGVLELVPRLLQAARQDLLAVQQKILSHFSENQLQRKPRCWEEGRSRQRLSQRFGELGVSGRLRRGQVGNTTKFRLVKGEVESSNDIIYMHPRHPLSAVAERPSKPQLEREEHEVRI